MPISRIENNSPVSTNVDRADNEAVDFKKGIDAWANETAPGENRAVAAQRIMEAYSCGTDILNLESLGLTTLPAQIGQLIDLQALNINDNQLTDIANLSSLIKLRSLDCARNQITDIAGFSSLINLKYLCFSNNRITDITSLSSLTKLSVLRAASNQLTDITSLSKLINLELLSLSRNRITDIAALSKLTLLSELFLSDNRLTDIAALSNLDLLEDLRLSDNQLTDITVLPNLIRLLHLDLCGNRLTSIPESLFRFPDHCRIDLENNRFSEAVIEQLSTTINAANYTGPRIRCLMANLEDQGYKVRSLADVVADWYQDSTSNSLTIFSSTTWKAVDNEGLAELFSIFLQRLHDTENATRPIFRTKVLDWLKRLEGDQELRHEIFFEAREGLGACEDRISLAFNAMKQRELTLNVERQRYDSKLDELISLARQAFRFNELEKMAHEKVKSLRFVEEVAVYLAYLVKVHKELSLDIDTPEMCFFEISGVTKVDIQAAILRVKQNENAQFLNYLANEWTPWSSVLKRLQKEAYEKLDARISTAQAKAFEEKQAALAADSSATDVSHLQLTREELDQIAASHKREFTQAFLKEKGLEDLLNPVW